MEKDYSKIVLEIASSIKESKGRRTRGRKKNETVLPLSVTVSAIKEGLDKERGDGIVKQHRTENNFQGAES